MGRVVKKAEERRKEIIEASRDLFLKQGYENTTMQDVMTKLQIAKGTTYHYFKSKEELLEAVVEDMADVYMAGIKKSLDVCQGNALEKMQVLVEAGRVAPRQAETLEDLHSPANMGMHGRILASLISRLAPLYAEVIAQGCREGFFSVAHPLECAEVLLAGVQFITDVGCFPWKEEDLKRRAKVIPALLEDLLQAPKGSLQFFSD